MRVRDGVLRWTDDQSEVSLFGVNYYVPFYKDHQRLRERGLDHRQAILEDLSHFQRLGIRCLRLHTFEREFSDRDGNFIDNEHVELLDFLIAECAKRDIYVVLTPIAWWGTPNSLPFPFAAHHASIREMVSQPEAWRRQARFLTQYGRHRNRYTGRTYAEDPAIPVFELINEPLYPKDMTDSQVTSYINALADGLRASGTTKPIFYSAWQNRQVACGNARIDGVTHSWYPSGLVNGHELTDDYLGAVSDFPALRHPALRGKARMIYEFDCADILRTTMYPAMARTFRSVGVQIANQFQYEVLRLADTNGNWQTHYLNLAYTPGKAIAFAIAAKAFADIPLGTNFPAETNRTFFSVRLSHELDLAERITETEYLHSNSTGTPAPRPDALERVWGVGSSPLVACDGNGAHFLDRLAPGDWLLELYPSTAQLRDPFSGGQTEKVRLYDLPATLTLHLPDLGDAATLIRLDQDEPARAIRPGQPFALRPGQYRVTRRGVSPAAPLPNRDFRLPPTTTDLTPFLTLDAPQEHSAALGPLAVTARGFVPADAEPPQLCGDYPDGSSAFRVPLRRLSFDRFEAHVPTEGLRHGTRLSLYLTLTHDGQTLVFPGGQPLGRLVRQPAEWPAVRPGADTALSTDGTPAQGCRTDILPDERAIRHTAAHGYGTPDCPRNASGVRIALDSPLPADARPNAILLDLAGDAVTPSVEVGLQTADGSAFGTAIPISADRQRLLIPFASLKPLWGTRAQQLDVRSLVRLTLITGAWLYPQLADRPHSFTLHQATLVQLPDIPSVSLLPPDRLPAILSASALHQPPKGNRTASAAFSAGDAPDERVLRFSAPTFKAEKDHATFWLQTTQAYRQHQEAYRHATAIVLTARALHPRTTAIEIVFTEKDGTPWGNQKLPLSTEWQDIVIPLRDLYLFSHWNSAFKPRRPDDHLDPAAIRGISVCFGKFIYGDDYDQPHAFEIKRISVR